MKHFNNWLGNKLADGLSTMAFFWFCLILDIIEGYAIIKQTINSIQTHQGMLGVIILWVSFISQTVIQLLALPLLAFQNKQQTENHKETIRHLTKIHKHLGITDAKR